MEFTKYVQVKYDCVCESCAMRHASHIINIKTQQYIKCHTFLFAAHYFVCEMLRRAFEVIRHGVHTIAIVVA